MDNVASQVSGSSSVLAADWNTYVRDNFDDIKSGHVIVADAAVRVALGVVAVGTMVFEVSTSKLWVYTTGWFELANFLQNTAVSAGGAPFAPVYSPVGMVTPFGGAAAPTGWLLCNGAALNSVTTLEYTALFGIIGTSFGGSGAAAFNVPNLLGRGVIGAGVAGSQNGTSGSGALTGGTALTARALGAFFGDQNLQSHTHAAGYTGSVGTGINISDPGHGHTSRAASGTFNVNAGGDGYIRSQYIQDGNFSNTNGNTTGITASLANGTLTISGNSGVHDQTAGVGQNSEPNVALTYIIKY